MQKVVVGVAMLLISAVASADVSNRTYKSIHDVTMMSPQEDTRSCGKAARDLLRSSVQRVSTVTVSAKTLRTNDGTPWEIDERTSDHAYATKIQKDPTPDFPNRTTMYIAGVGQTGDGGDFVYIFSRTVISGDDRCSDTFVVSVE